MALTLKYLLVSLAMLSTGVGCERTYSNNETGKAAFAKTIADTATHLRGFTFAHEGYSGKNGYGGELAEASLDSLSALHINAIALVPYTFMREPNVPADLPIAKRRGMETDSAVLHAARLAQQRGWFVLLKPQIWLGGGHWPGDIDFSEQKEWDIFFKAYSDWMMHYARFAERHNIEALCIGTELGRVSLRQPGFWRKLIKEIRGEYSGQLTYAANWGEEFENIEFWADLDAVGCNGYYPLSPKPDATDAELAAGAAAWLTRANAVAAQAGRPLWLTEIGYRSVEATWMNPHEAPNYKPVSDDCQRRSYEALFAATPSAPLLTGMFVWKWPSYLGHGYESIRTGQDSLENMEGEGPKGYAPGGKAAASVVARFYENWR